jgi:hypothetical protein
VKTFALAHPLAILGTVGGALLLVGVYDVVRSRSEKKRAQQAAATA